MQASISGTMKKADTKLRDKEQQKTFINWVNVMLKSTKYHIEVKDLQVDLKDGLVLIALLEALAGDGKIGNYNKRPNIKAAMMDNLDTCFKFMDSQNIKLVNIGRLLNIKYKYVYSYCKLICATPISRVPDLFRAGRYRLDIISAHAEKGLDRFTGMTGIYYHRLGGGC